MGWVEGVTRAVGTGYEQRNRWRGGAGKGKGWMDRFEGEDEGERVGWVNIG